MAEILKTSVSSIRTKKSKMGLTEQKIFTITDEVLKDAKF